MPDVAGEQTFVSLGVASQRCGMTADALRRRVQAGTVKGDFVGGRWIVAASEVERLKAERSGASPAESAA
jgi:hypothetical protein